MGLPSLTGDKVKDPSTKKTVAKVDPKDDKAPKVDPTNNLGVDPNSKKTVVDTKTKKPAPKVVPEDKTIYSEVGINAATFFTNNNDPLCSITSCEVKQKGCKETYIG